MSNILAGMVLIVLAWIAAIAGALLAVVLGSACPDWNQRAMLPFVF